MGRPDWNCPPIEQGFEECAGVGLGVRDLLWCSLGDDQAATRATFGSHVDQPVGGLDHVEVVLDHHHGVTSIDQPRQDSQQFADVFEVKASCWLIQDIQGSACGPLLQLTGELDALRLAA